MFSHETDEFVANFLNFILDSHALMGQAEYYGKDSRELARVEFYPNNSTNLSDEIITASWGQLANKWAVLETPANYGLTMGTILEFLRSNDRLRRDERETYVSLGAGPGLYELYLAQLCEKIPECHKLRFICVDAAPEMTSYTNKLIEKLRVASRVRLRNICAITANMTALPFADHSVSQFLVNNNLGWVPDWQQVIREITRVITPDRMGYASFFVHPHPMMLRDQEGKPIHQLNSMRSTDLMDYLEENGCSIEFTRLFAGQGTGQAGHDTNRIFIKGRFISENPGSWRERAAQNQVKTSFRSL